VRKWGAPTVLWMGLGFWALLFFLTPMVYQMGIVLGGLVVAATAIPASLTGVSLSTWISLKAKDQQGMAAGAAQRAAALGEFLAPATAGFFYEIWYGLPYWVGSLLLFLGAMAIFIGEKYDAFLDQRSAGSAQAGTGS